MKLLLFVIAVSVSSFGTTPGKHAVALTWVASVTPGVTYNVYRGTATWVCSGTPTPYATGVTATNFLDQSAAGGTTEFYAVSAVGTGGESACTAEVQVQIPNPPATPSGLAATVQ